MSCKIRHIESAQISNSEKERLSQIYRDIFKQAKESKAFREINNRLQVIKKDYNAATTLVGKINSQYGKPVSRLNSIGNGNAVLSVNVLPLSKEQQSSIFIQKPSIDFQLKDIQSVNNSKIVDLSRDLINRIGVDYQKVKDIRVNGIKIGANGIADITKGIIQVIDGKESEALPEEAMHFAVEIIEQKDEKLFNKLLREINDYPIYKEVLATYSKDPLYQTSEGKPDIRKLKKEAIAKQLVNVIINKTEGNEASYPLIAKTQTWWQQIFDFIRNLFISSGFDTLAFKVIKGENIGSIEDIQEGSSYLQLNKQEEVFNKLKDVSSQIEKRDDGYYIDNKKVPRRVTDLVKDWYERRFREKQLTASEYDKATYELKAEKGTKGHEDIEHAFSVLVNEEGFIREELLDDSSYVSQLDPENRSLYDLLKENLKDRLDSYPAGTRFMSEIMVYDQKRQIAGTIDFLAIEPSGKVNILDWKFMDLNINKYKDVSWYKVTAWQQQMDQYKLILEKIYNVKPQEFGQTRMIPIKAHYRPGDRKKNILPKLMSIQIGDVNVKNIEQDYLLPVSTEGESTGNKKIDSLIEKLNAVYKKFSETKVPQSERLAKNEQLNSLFEAIRQLQIKGNIKPLLHQAKILNKQIEKTINKYNNQWLEKDPSSFTQEQISNFYEEIETSQNAIIHYTTLDTDLKFLFKGDLSEEDKALKEEIRDTVDNARELQSELFEIGNDFTAGFVAGSENVNNLLSPEKVIKGITKWFSSTATLQLKSIETLYKKANRAFTYASMDTLDETKKLEKIKKEYDKWANSKGLKINNYFSYIKKEDKNELIDEYKSEFFSELKKRIQDFDIKWIKENIDKQAYQKYLTEKIITEIQRINDKPRVGTEAEIQGQIKKEIADVKRTYTIMLDDSPGWYLYNDIKKFPKKEWETKEWRELHKEENKPALTFYNYIKERNEYYQEIGYINKAEARVFLPFVRKSVVEKIITGSMPKFGEQFLRTISIDEGDIGYGKVDPLTGRPIDTIPIYFTKEIEGELSGDLFRNMALYNEAAIRYKYLSDIEAQARALLNTERNKKAIATSMFGKTVYRDGKLEYTPDNNENTKLLEDMVKGIIYGQRYIQSETFDQILGNIGSFGKKFNDKLGINIFPEDLEGRQISINKVITQLNNTFQLNALGLNPLSALSNLLGGTFQSAINAGTYFTKSDFAASELWLLANKMTGKDQKKMIGVLEYFLPLTDSYNKEIAKKLSLSKLSQENIQEFLMILMRKSDWFVQTANFYAFINNSIVEDGKVVNAREYVRSLPEFSEMFKGSLEQRKEKNRRFEEKVKSLIEEKGVLKVGKLEDDTFVIPGVDRKDQSVVELRRKVQQISKNALGNLSEDDLRAINMNIYGKSFMLFKNWIPRLVDVRLGNLKYNSASDAYEWGRSRMVFRLLTQDLVNSLDSLQDSLLGTGDKWVDQVRKLYEAKKQDYEQDTGKTLEMTEDEFISLVRRNVRAQLKDTLIMLTLFALYLGMKAFEPEDVEDENVKNYYKFMLKATDKIKDELAYFYDPTSLTSLVSSGIFPSVAYITNFKKVLINFGKENYALFTGDEELQDKNYVIKYLMKSFPISNQAQGMLPMFYPELAKDLGIRMSTQARPVNL